MTFDAGSGSLRVRAEAIDQLIAAITSATAPARSMGTSPKLRLSERLTKTDTPPIPIKRASASRNVSRCVRRMTISESVMKTGMVASMTAAIPEGTRCSAQNNKP